MITEAVHRPPRVLQGDDVDFARLHVLPEAKVRPPGWKRIAMFFDGTWQDPDNNTNVWRMKNMVDNRSDSDGVQQVVFYHPGVGSSSEGGSSLKNEIFGGIFAIGFEEILEHGYKWLSDKYNNGDELFVFGFSRGAFIARSFVGMIATCGLLLPGAPIPSNKVMERYKLSSTSNKPNHERTGTPAKLPLYRLRHEVLENHKDPATLDVEERSLLAYSRRIPIKFLGVWDTVASLGTQYGPFDQVSSVVDAWNNIRPTSIIQHAVQALALDEHRTPFIPSMFTQFIPSDESEEQKKKREENNDQRYQQRWFIGSHSNVGGGLGMDQLSDVPLDWIIRHAQKNGLRIRARKPLFGDEYLAPVEDSYGKFVFGAAKYFPFFKATKRVDRTLYPAVRKTTNGKSGYIIPLQVTIDQSVIMRWQQSQVYKKGDDYNPESLQEWAKMVGVSLERMDPKTSVWAHNGEPVEESDEEAQ